MKKTLLFITVTICLLSSCKLDDAGFKQNSINTGTDGSTNVTTASIVGMWFLKTQHSVGTALGIPVDETDPGTVKDYYLFKADNTVEASSTADGLETGTYTYNATTKKISLTKGGTTTVFTVNKLTTDAMELYTTVSVPAVSTSLNVTTTFTH